MSNTASVVYRDDKELRDAGFAPEYTAGWYFTDEVQNLVGPYPTVVAAAKALEAYEP